MEPEGLREEFLALQAAHAALVDQLAAWPRVLAATIAAHAERENELATRIGQLEARVARLTMQRSA